jgi:hypothetical protein
VLPGGRIQVESWFDLTGESPVGAKVSVYRKASESVLLEGKLNEKGLFVFSYANREPLRIVVSAAGGHRKEVEIPTSELTSVEPASTASSTPEPTAEAKAFADRSSRISPKDVLLGLALLLALAALALAVGNARKLRDLQRNLGELREK